MKIPQPDNVASVLVDGEMWSTAAHDGTPGWAAGGRWFDVPGFEAYLAQANTVAFYSPTGQVIRPEE